MSISPSLSLSLFSLEIQLLNLHHCWDIQSLQIDKEKK